MLRSVRKTVCPRVLTRAVHDFESTCGMKGEIYGPEHYALQVS